MANISPVEPQTCCTKVAMACCAANAFQAVPTQPMQMVFFMPGHMGCTVPDVPQWCDGVPTAVRSEAAQAPMQYPMGVALATESLHLPTDTMWQAPTLEFGDAVMPGQLEGMVQHRPTTCDRTSMAAQSQFLHAPTQFPMKHALGMPSQEVITDNMWKECTVMAGEAPDSLDENTMLRKRRQQPIVPAVRDLPDGVPIASEEGVHVEELVRGVVSKLESGQQQAAMKTFRALAFKDSASSRAAQFLLTEVNSSDAAALAHSLQGCVRKAVASKHANYVVQKIVQTLPASVAAFIVEELVGVGEGVARHIYGCRVLCRLLEHMSLDVGAEHTAALFNQVLDKVDELCCHKFGSYVIQHLLEFGLSHHRHTVASAVRKNLAEISNDQFGSKIVEWALQFCSADDQDAICRDLVSNPKQLVSLAAEGRYGRFVVKALLKTPGEHSKLAQQHLRSAAWRLRASRYGKGFLNSLQSVSSEA